MRDIHWYSKLAWICPIRPVRFWGTCWNVNIAMRHMKHVHPTHQFQIQIFNKNSTSTHLNWAFASSTEYEPSASVGTTVVPDSHGISTWATSALLSPHMSLTMSLIGVVLWAPWHRGGAMKRRSWKTHSCRRWECAELKRTMKNWVVPWGACTYFKVTGMWHESSVPMCRCPCSLWSTKLVPFQTSGNLYGQGLDTHLQTHLWFGQPTLNSLRVQSWNISLPMRSWIITKQPFFVLAIAGRLFCQS